MVASCKIPFQNALLQFNCTSFKLQSCSAEPLCPHPVCPGGISKFEGLFWTPVWHVTHLLFSYLACSLAQAGGQNKLCINLPFMGFSAGSFSRREILNKTEPVLAAIYPSAKWTWHFVTYQRGVKSHLYFNWHDRNFSCSDGVPLAGCVARKREESYESEILVWLAYSGSGTAAPAWAEVLQSARETACEKVTVLCEFMCLTPL